MEGSKGIPSFLFFIPFIIAFFTLSLPIVWQQELIVNPLRPEPFGIDIKANNKTIQKLPVISARSALILDVSTNSIVFSKNPNFRFTPASTTKIMTALVSLNYYKTEDVLTVGTETIIGSKMYLVSGEKITVENLLYGLLLNSGNDAAYTLAQNYPGGLEEFINKMNQTAKELKLSNTHFVDPAGIDDEGNYTTALDLSNLAKTALQNPVFAKIVATQEKTVFDTTGGLKHELKNLNKLLWDVPGVAGVKTGFTEKAGGVLVTLLKNQRQFLFVVFRSDDRFTDTKNLIDWTARFQ